MADQFDFGLGNITKMFQDQSTLQQTRQKEALKNQQKVNAAAGNQAELTKKSAEISQSLVNELQPLVTLIDDTESGREEQAELFSSGNLGDMLAGIGNQVLDPGKYTQSGRMKRVAEANQLMNAKTTVAGLQQAALADMGKVIEADLKAGEGALNLAVMTEQQNMEMINTELARVGAMSQTLAQNQQLQSAALASMSSDQVRAAAASSKGKPVDVGGVLISPGALEERIATLDARAEIQESRTLAQESRKMDLDAKLARRELETMSIEELRPIMLSGDPAGRFKLEEVKQVYDMKTQALNDEIARTGKMISFTDFGANVIVPAANEVERIAPAVPKNTPLAGAVDSYRRTIGTAAQLAKPYQDANKPVPLEVSILASGAIKGAREELDKAIESQAKIQSKGDKDLYDVYVETYRGNPAPRASVESAIRNRLEKNRPLDDILPPATAKLVNQKFNEKYQQALQANIMNPAGNSAESKKLLKDQAMQDAINESVGQEISSRTLDLISTQVEVPNSPLNGLMTGTEIVNRTADADSRGKENFMKMYNLTPQEMDTVLQGGTVPDKGVGARQIKDLGYMQIQEFMLDLDSIQMGLSKKYRDWWTQNGQAYIDSTKAAREAAAQAAGIQSQAFESYAGPMEAEQTQAVIQDTQAAFDGYQNVRESKYREMVSFDFIPENRQAALLQFDGTLNDRDRSVMMKDFMLPIINEGKKKGLEYDQINILVEQAIQNGKSDNPEVQKVLKKVQTNRTDTVENLESITQKPFSWKAGPGEPRMGMYPDRWLNRTVTRRRYQWYEDIMKGQQ